MSISEHPRITQEEFLLAQTSIYYSPNKFADGRGNYSPEAILGMQRGARLDSNGPLFRSDMKIIDQAMRDLADYLNFTNVNDYLNAILTEGSKIFLRATTPLSPPVNIPATSTYPFPLLTPDNLQK